MKLQHVTACPVCGSDGVIVLEDCRDFLFDIPGSWTFRKCNQCNSLWLDPCPTKEMIPSLYQDGYCTHDQPQRQLQPPLGFWSQLRYSSKLAILERSYSYTGLSQKASLSIGKSLGKLLSFLPELSKWAGYTIRFLPYRHQGRLLDVGCGNGKFLWLMHELGWEVEGIEPDPLAAKIAKSMNLKVMQGVIEDANLEPSSYDAITMHHVLEHLPASKAVLSQLAVSLKTGGTLVSISPNPSGTMSRWFKNSWRGLEPPRHLVLPSVEGYKLMMESLGFQVNVWTTMQTVFWMYRESRSIQHTGKTGNYQKWVIPRILSTVGSLLLPLLPTSGEEVVCVAVKK